MKSSWRIHRLTSASEIGASSGLWKPPPPSNWKRGCVTFRLIFLLFYTQESTPRTFSEALPGFQASKLFCAYAPQVSHQKIIHSLQTLQTHAPPYIYHSRKFQDPCGDLQSPCLKKNLPFFQPSPNPLSENRKLLSLERLLHETLKTDRRQISNHLMCLHPGTYFRTLLRIMRKHEARAQKHVAEIPGNAMRILSKQCRCSPKRLRAPSKLALGTLQTCCGYPSKTFPIVSKKAARNFKNTAESRNPFRLSNFLKTFVTLYSGVYSFPRSTFPHHSAALFLTPSHFCSYL